MMKNKKILIAVSVMAVILIAIASVSYALEFKSNAEIIAGLTGKSVDEVQKAREAGSSYGEQAADAGKLEAFKDARLEQMKANLAELVKEGRLTQAEADARIKLMEDRMGTCTGTGENQGQGGFGGGLGGGNGLRNGTGAGKGMGSGVGGGRGMMAGRAA